MSESREELLAEFVVVSNVKLSTEETNDFLQSPPEVQAQMLANKMGEDWTPPGPTGIERALAIVTLLGNIGASVSGIAGAVAALRAL